MTKSEAFQIVLMEAAKERKALLEAIGDRSVSAAKLTRQLYPDAFVPSPTYLHIRLRLVQMVKRGELLCDDPKPRQERLYYKPIYERTLL